MVLNFVTVDRCNDYEYKVAEAKVDGKNVDYHLRILSYPDHTENTGYARILIATWYTRIYYDAVSREFTDSGLALDYLNAIHTERLSGGLSI